MFACMLLCLKNSVDFLFHNVEIVIMTVYSEYQGGIPCRRKIVFLFAYVCVNVGAPHHVSGIWQQRYWN